MASNQTLAIQAPYRIQGLSIVLSITLRNGLSNQSIQQSTRIYLSANQFSTEKYIKKGESLETFSFMYPDPGSNRDGSESTGV